MTAPVVPGDVIAGKYEVTRVLGAGGMGVVVAAHDRDLERDVAVKFLSAQGAENANVVARFMREAKAAVKISSEHVAKVIEVGRLDGGAPYIVMELLDGCDLSDEVAKGPLPVEAALDYVLQACEAIAEAHSRGIVHRDLKPANLFLSKRADGTPMVKVLDFGISSMGNAATAEHGLTRTGAIMGSPFYMSPEQAKSARSADARSDIWSLGAVLYELMAGRPPFTGETMGELVAAILTEEPALLGSLRAEVPSGLEAVVHRCLHKDPGARYSSVGELAQALSPFAPERARVSVTRAIAVSGSATAATPAAPMPAGGTLVMSAAPTAPAAGANTAAAWAETQAPSSPGRGRLWAAGIAGVALVGVVALGVSLRQGATVGAALSSSIAPSLGAPPDVPTETPPSAATAAPLPPPAASNVDVPDAAAPPRATAGPKPAAGKPPPAAPRPSVASAAPPAPPPKPTPSAKPSGLQMPLQ
ncbi:MAG: serine/threonine protein kinase [Polyangiaceae bacterium]|nr:serine/threonine protein kinase [Polyangiaceae bacterium]